jgi:hypothetical protein
MGPALPFSKADAPGVMPRQDVNWRITSVAPSRRIVVAYNNVNRLDFFTPAGEYVTSAAGPQPVTVSFDRAGPEKLFEWRPESELAYVDVTSTDRYVYALFCGCRRSDIRKSFANKLHVFTWDGRFVAELVVEPAVYKIAVPPGDSLLVAATWTPFPSLGVWRVPSLAGSKPAPVLAERPREGHGR